MIKLLHTIPALDGGGADRVLYDYAMKMTGDFQMDFIVHSEYEGMLEKDLISKGCKVFRVPPLHKNRREYKKRINEIIKTGNYDIVHVSQGYRGVYFLHCAKRYGVKCRIAHSHMAYIPGNFVGELIRKVTSLYAKYCATHLFACGDDAAKWMWGEQDFSKGRIYIMKNAIDVERFSFSLDKRECLRKELGIEDKFVIGNVARFSNQKNHEFLIRLFYEIKKLRKNAVLMLVGRGELEEDIKNQVEKFGLADSVLFMGIRNDVHDLLNAMDVFVLPSKYEGLPVTLIEVQANGLPAVISDAITREMTFSNDFLFVPLCHSALDWAKVILEKNRTNSCNWLKDTSYDLQVAVNELQCKYLSILADIGDETNENSNVSFWHKTRSNKNVSTRK